MIPVIPIMGSVSRKDENHKGKGKNQGWAEMEKGANVERECMRGRQGFVSFYAWKASLVSFNEANFLQEKKGFTYVKI